jgi:hypothetical protein
MAYTRRNSHNLLKGKQVYSALFGVHTEALHDLTEFPKESAAKEETAESTITKTSFNKEFREQKRPKRKPSYDADKKTKKPTTPVTG